MENLKPYLIIFYIFSIITLILVTFGLVGAQKEKRWALILFAVGMILSSLTLIAGDIQERVMRPEVVKEVTSHYLDMLPLANASQSFLRELKDAQMNYRCCGVDRGYQDWGYNISESCVCTGESTGPCVAAPRNSSLFERAAGGEAIMVYSVPCLQSLVDQELDGLDLAFGLYLGAILLWILAVALCVAILYQLNRTTDTPAVVYSQEAKAGNYIVLTDAAEIP